jgi:flagellar biosynthesis regulator FlaF
MKLPASAAAYLNHQRTSYTRIQYSDRVWSQIVKNFNRPKYYNETFRAAAISDTYSFVK